MRRNRQLIEDAACTNLQGPGPRTNTGPGPHQRDFNFLNRSVLRRQKDAHEIRNKLALDLLKEYVAGSVTAPVLKAGIAAAGKYVRGRINRKALEATRDASLDTIHLILQSGSSATSLKAAARIAFLGTMIDIYSQSIVEYVHQLLAWRAFESDPKSSWWEWKDRLAEDYYQNAARFLLRHMPKDVRTAWSRMLRERSQVDDPRFEFRGGDYLRFAFSEKARRSKNFRLASLALDAFEACQHRSTISRSDIQPLLDVVLDDSSYARRTATYMLLTMAQHFGAARDALLTALDDPRSAVRFDVISRFQFCARLVYPRDFVAAFLRKAIEDRSEKNRRFAAQGCAHFDCNELVPDLIRLSKTEKSARTRDEMRQNAELVRDGFCVCKTLGSTDVSVGFKVDDHYTFVVFNRKDFKKLTRDELKRRIDEYRSDRNCPMTQTVSESAYA